MLRDLTERYFIKSACKPDEYVHEYISKLLPREIDYFKSKNIFSEVIKTDILVQLVGFSWEPLFISLCAYQPETLVLVLNKNIMINWATGGDGLQGTYKQIKGS